MYCSKCGTDNKDTCMFCSACGAPLKVAAQNPIPQPKDYVKEKSSPKKKRKLLLIIAIAVLLVAVAIVAVLLLTRDKSTEVYVPELYALVFDNNTGYTCTFTYNNDGTPKQKIYDYNCYNYDPKYYGARETHDFSYDKDNKTISVAVTRSVELFDGSYEIDQTYQIDYYYNDSGQVTEAIYYNNSYNTSDATFQQVLYKYDEDGNMIKSKYYVFSDDGKDLILTRTYTYTKQMNESRLQSVETKRYEYDDGTVFNSYSRNYTYTYFNDNTIEGSYSDEDGYRDDVSLTYNCQTIENTSEIDMQSFITIIAFF